MVVVQEWRVLPPAMSGSSLFVREEQIGIYVLKLQSKSVCL